MVSFSISIIIIYNWGVSNILIKYIKTLLFRHLPTINSNKRFQISKLHRKIHNYETIQKRYHTISSHTIDGPTGLLPVFFSRNGSIIEWIAAKADNTTQSNNKPAKRQVHLCFCSINIVSQLIWTVNQTPTSTKPCRSIRKPYRHRLLSAIF